jgi:PhzF family phenazine biosynthesis protein
VTNLRLYQVDAFAERLFEGNPAAVVPLEDWLPDSLMQSIATENNLSETAFFVKTNDNDDAFEIRWFTPAAEVPLCGHATLASAAVLGQRLGRRTWPVEFRSASGPLRVDLDGDRYVLDLPADPPRPAEIPDGLIAALGADFSVCLLGRAGYLLVFDEERQVHALRPDFGLLARAVESAIVTAPGDSYDFISRFFAPRLGIDEDPVTGAGHCVLVPYWAERLDRGHLVARQISARGGNVECEIREDRVFLTGSAAFYLDGEISVPDQNLSQNPS